jgi:hypothetical protein
LNRLASLGLEAGAVSEEVWDRERWRRDVGLRRSDALTSRGWGWRHSTIAQRTPRPETIPVVEPEKIPHASACVDTDAVGGSTVLTEERQWPRSVHEQVPNLVHGWQSGNGL